MHRAFVIGAVVMLVLLGRVPRASATHTGLLFGAPTRVNVVMTEYKFAPGAITVEAGQAVDLILENQGIIAHNFMVYPRPKAVLKGVGPWWTTCS